MKLLENPQYVGDLKRAICNNETDFLRDKSILITGGTGLIGSSIVDLLLLSNKIYDLNVHIVLASRDEDKVKNRFPESNLISWISYDALQPFSFKGKVDYIIHSAGNASPELYISQAIETMMGNIIGINNLLDYASNIVDCKVIYVSSSEVYGLKNSMEPYSEEDYGFIDFLSNRASYSSSKRAAESLCKAYCNEKGVHACIVRPGHIFGPTATEKDRRLSSAFAYRAAQGKELSLKSSGCQIRSYMYCLDCARAILKVLEVGISGEAYNICGSEVSSIKEISECFAEAGKVKLTYVNPSEDELLAFNPMDNSSLSNKKLYSIGYESVFTIKEGVSHTVSILKSGL